MQRYLLIHLKSLTTVNLLRKYFCGVIILFCIIQCTYKMSVNKYVFIFIYIYTYVNNEFLLCHILHRLFSPVKILWNIHNSICNVTSIFREGKDSCKYC
jgi:hypothetical protein